jgi:DNA sulfur modification protein DndB
LTALPGHWLLKHSTPSWRIDKPHKGFQRIVKEERARQIAVAVLDQHRTFPNAIILATDQASFASDQSELRIPRDSRFLVVDGQHRLWAQKFSEFEATYACVIHMGLSEVEMARLFLEINDNQKRVPASLRWDLVRLVRPDDDPYAIAAAELVWELNKDEASPLFQRIDLTGEQKEISLKQGSLAPELRTLASTRLSGFRDLDFETQYDTIVRYLSAIRSLDGDGWKKAETPLYHARILRSLIRLLPVIIKKIGKKPPEVTTANYRHILSRIQLSTLSGDAIRAAQGSAGMKQIHDMLRDQMSL